MIDFDDDGVLTLEDFARFKRRKPVKKREDYFKPVVEYNMEGVPLREYSNCKEAGDSNGLLSGNISNICRGIYKYSTKVMKIFLYRGDDIEKRMALIENVFKTKKTLPKPVVEYTLGGRLLYVYDNMTQAASVNNITPLLVSSCCKGKRLYIDKKIFLFKGDDIKQRVKEVKSELYRLSHKKPRYLPVDVYTLEGKFIKGFPSASAASRELKVHVSNIARCCHGTDEKGNPKLTASGKIFLWLGESISERLKLIKEKKK